MSKQYLGEKALAMKTLNEDIYECNEHVKKCDVCAKKLSISLYHGHLYVKKCDVSQQYHMIRMENLDEIS